MSCGRCPRVCCAPLSYTRLTTSYFVLLRFTADDSENSSFSGRVTPPESTTLSSSRTSSSSNLGENSSTSDPANSSAGLPVSASSGLLDVSRSAEDEQKPQLDIPDTSAMLEFHSTGSPEVDPQIIEALKSKDRLFVLKLGEQMEALIKERL